MGAPDVGRSVPYGFGGAARHRDRAVHKWWFEPLVITHRVMGPTGELGIQVAKAMLMGGVSGDGRLLVQKCGLIYERDRPGSGACGSRRPGSADDLVAGATPTGPLPD